jgi:hypothetical protein
VRYAPGALQPQRQEEPEAAGKQRRQFGGGKEVDVQALLRSGEVPDGLAAVIATLGYLVRGPDIGRGRVDPQAEQATRREPLLR